MKTRPRDRPQATLSPITLMRTPNNNNNNNNNNSDFRWNRATIHVRLRLVLILIPPLCPISRLKLPYHVSLLLIRRPLFLEKARRQCTHHHP
jgi:hypothetical protein